MYGYFAAQAVHTEHRESTIDSEHLASHPTVRWIEELFDCGCHIRRLADPP